MNIYTKITSLFMRSKPQNIVTEATSAVNKATENVADTIQETKELLPKAQYCYKYWASALDEQMIRQSNRTSVDLHGQLHGINHHFILKKATQSQCENMLTQPRTRVMQMFIFPMVKA